MYAEVQISRKKQSTVGLGPRGFMTYDHATGTDTVVLAEGQASRAGKQESRDRPALYHQLIYTNGANGIQREKGNLFNKCGWNDWISVWENQTKPNHRGLTTVSDQTHVIRDEPQGRQTWVEGQLCACAHFPWGALCPLPGIRLLPSCQQLPVEVPIFLFFTEGACFRPPPFPHPLQPFPPNPTLPL